MRRLLVIRGQYITKQTSRILLQVTLESVTKRIRVRDVVGARWRVVLEEGGGLLLPLYDPRLLSCRSGLPSKRWQPALAPAPTSSGAERAEMVGGGGPGLGRGRLGLVMGTCGEDPWWWKWLAAEKRLEIGERLRLIEIECFIGR